MDFFFFFFFFATKVDLNMNPQNAHLCMNGAEARFCLQMLHKKRAWRLSAVSMLRWWENLIMK